ncbi:MAG: FtsW/RodA/SpoVE family cell cycle protein, partial [Moraxella sp.]|nr:FtsW/RodA/SpoVE family cell cycle protein [Moraxella sp.]
LRTGLNKAMSLIVFYVPIIGLLLFQPDFGSTAVLAGTLIAMFAVVGVPLMQFVVMVLFLVVGGVIVIITSDYRIQRVTSFINPHDDPMGEDYQLLRSLIAFARGEVTGVGYGNSVQKLEHLPEAHTDFLLAITGEELGLVGVLFVIVLEFIVVFAIMRISYRTLMLNQLKLSYTSFGFGVLIFGHVLINAGMNLGLLPTKGLTMPFFSYGGSSMLFSVIMIAIVLKIDRVSPYIAKAGKNNNY